MQIIIVVNQNCTSKFTAQISKKENWNTIEIWNIETVIQNRINLDLLDVYIKSIFVRYFLESRYLANNSSDILRHYKSSLFQIEKIITAFSISDRDS